MYVCACVCVCVCVSVCVCVCVYVCLHPNVREQINYIIEINFHDFVENRGN